MSFLEGLVQGQWVLGQLQSFPFLQEEGLHPIERLVGNTTHDGPEQFGLVLVDLSLFIL